MDAGEMRVAPGTAQRETQPVHDGLSAASVGALGRLPGSVAGSAEFAFTIDELPALRRHVSLAAEHASLGAERAMDLVTAVNELASNSICYGGGFGTLRVWSDDEALTCEVRDRGHMAHPARRRRAPGPNRLTGRGLWIVEQLCDAIQVLSSPDSGTRVRVQMRLR
jgi:anti-sigma regulatory factor (Ser/Thr protein kinase)